MSLSEKVPYKAYTRTDFTPDNRISKHVIAPLSATPEDSYDLELSLRGEVINRKMKPLGLSFYLPADVYHDVMFDNIPMQMTSFIFPIAQGESLVDIEGKLDAITVQKLGLWLAQSMKATQVAFRKAYPDTLFCGNGDIKPPHVIGRTILDWDTSIVLPDLPPFTGGFVTEDFTSLAHLELRTLSEEALALMSQDVVSIVKVMIWSAVGDAAYPNIIVRNIHTNKVSQDTHQVSFDVELAELWKGHTNVLITMIDTLLRGESVAENTYYQMSGLSVAEVDVFHEMLKVMRDVLERDIQAFDRSEPTIRMGMDEFIFRLEHLDTESFAGVLEPHPFSQTLTIA